MDEILRPGVPLGTLQQAARSDHDITMAPGDPVWSYSAPERQSFFAPFISGAHRLETGNTFVCSGPQGRFFEVTPDGTIVWEYRNPFHGEVPGWSPPGTE